MDDLKMLQLALWADEFLERVPTSLLEDALDRYPYAFSKAQQMRLVHMLLVRQGKVIVLEEVRRKRAQDEADEMRFLGFSLDPEFLR